MTTHYLACDLGAESGRLMLGSLAPDGLELEEVHRFPNGPVPAGDSLHWDFLRLFDELKSGLRQAGERALPIASISCDSWGVDYVLVDSSGAIVPPVFHYRDPRCARGVKALLARLPWETVFAETGIQFMPMNTAFQLAAEEPVRLANARQVLPIGDAINYLFSGVARAEVSLASTTQLYNPHTRAWSAPLLKAVNLSPEQLPALVTSGTRLGPLRPELARERGLAGVEVVAGCSHDTAAAVAAVPAVGDNWAYLSSGTWSLLGVELPEPVVSEGCRELNFTNEIGYGNSVRLLKNIVGLWLVQECRREWARAGEEFDYATLTQLAAEAPPFVSLIDAADPRFVAPGGMPGKIAGFCRQTGQPAPATPGAMIRCALESLALLYRQTVRELEQLTGRRIERLHIIGGGSQNALLNQFTADALQIPVLAGPQEATALGNVLVQAITLGHLPSLASARECVQRSFPPKEVLPGANAVEWDHAFERFLKLERVTDSRGFQIER